MSIIDKIKFEGFREDFFNNAGAPRATYGKIEYYRFDIAKLFVKGNSVLDVGAVYGDFLKRLKDKYVIKGTDINIERVNICNKNIGKEICVIDFKDGTLSTFDDKSVDTVVCLEVLEHIVDPQKGLNEFLRVARKRIIVSVPCDERITLELCVHCGKYTPRSGHLHSFNEMKIKQCLDNCTGNVEIIKLARFGSLILKFIPKFIPFRLKFLIDKLFCNLFPKYSGWIFCVFDKEE
jgi:SAM-dependent methyltransferase